MKKLHTFEVSADRVNLGLGENCVRLIFGQTNHFAQCPYMLHCCWIAQYWWKCWTTDLCDVLILVGHEQEAPIVQYHTVNMLIKTQSTWQTRSKKIQTHLQNSKIFKTTMFGFQKHVLGMLLGTLSFLRQPQISSLHCREEIVRDENWEFTKRALHHLLEWVKPPLLPDCNIGLSRASVTKWLPHVQIRGAGSLTLIFMVAFMKLFIQADTLSLTPTTAKEHIAHEMDGLQH